MRDFLLDWIIPLLAACVTYAVVYILSVLVLGNWLFEVTAHLGLVGQVTAHGAPPLIAAIAMSAVGGFVLWHQNRPQYGAW